MSWNLRTVLLLIALVQGLVAAFLLGRRFMRRRRWSDAFLAALLLVLCGNLMPHLVGWAGAYDRWPGLSFFPFASSFAIGPLLWFAVRALTEPTFRPVKADLLHAAPFAMEKAYYLWAWSQPLAWKNAFVDRWQDPVIAPAENLLAAVSVAAYLYAAWRCYGGFRRSVDASQSDAAYQLEWLRRFLLVAGTTAVVSLVFDLANMLHPLGYPVYFFRAFLFALLTYWLGVTALVLDPRPASEMQGLAVAAAPTGSPPPPPAANALAARLDHHMITARPWLNPTLTLAELAHQLDLTPHELSAAVNQGLGRNFNDFVNGYRVRAVQDAIRRGDASRLTLLAIALDNGFNAKSTFNRAFKKETGVSPSSWQP